MDLSTLAGLSNLPKINFPTLDLNIPSLNPTINMPKFAETADNVLVLGNGFDLGLGLNSSYKEFAKSKHWPFKNESLYPKGTLAYMLNENKDLDKWFDLEELFYEYASLQNGNIEAKGVTDLVSFNKDCFKILTNALTKYLKEEQAMINIEDKNLPFIVLLYFLQITGVSRIYTFNYTDINGLASRKGIKDDFECCHVHGSLNEDSCILGVGDKRELHDEYFFLHKSANPNFSSNKLIRDLAHAENIIIYGHSLGDNDHDYFKDFFVDSAEYENKYEGHERTITIFTFNEDSKLAIKKQIMKISNRNLISIFAHCNFEIICTSSSEDVQNYLNKLDFE